MKHPPSGWTAAQVRAFVEDFRRRVPDAAWRLLGHGLHQALISHEVLLIAFGTRTSPATLEEIRLLRIDFDARNTIVRGPPPSLDESDT